MPPVPARRWSKRALVLTVVGLVLATAVLTVGMVGFARSIGFVTRIGAASDVLNEVGQIAPDITVRSGVPVSSGANTSGGSGASAADGSVTSPAAPVAPTTATPTAAVSGASAGGAAGLLPGAQGEMAGGGGVAGSAGGGAAGSGGVAGAGGMAGGGGASTSGWDGILQSALTMLGQNTTQMCGPNTCNIGQVCCNLSCGTCVAPGATCDQTVCAGAARAPTAVRCGNGQCNDGQVCCNPSCGICALPGETCSTQSCP